MNAFLSSLINYEKGLLKYQMSHFDPLRVGRMLRESGFSWDGVKIFHVAGTKGKGSTSLYLSRLLQGVYNRVGLYTSPHLFHVEERIQVNEIPIAPQTLHVLVEEWKEKILQYECSFFEALTFLSMVYFLRMECEAVVLETGMGGRLDATNFVDRPQACVITLIGWDHTKFLGETLRAIALEKAGIIKPNCLVVSSPQEFEVAEVIRQRAREMNSSLVEVKHSYVLVSASCESWVYRFEEGDELWETRQWGEVFVGNFLLAKEVLRSLGLVVPEQWMRKVFARRLPFRMWYHSPFLFDVAHNPESFRALFQALEKISGEKELYIGILAEKELTRIVPVIQQYKHLFERVVCFDFVSPRPSGGNQLATLLGTGVEYSQDIPSIMEKKRLYVVTGSFYWVEEFFCRHGISREEIYT